MTLVTEAIDSGLIECYYNATTSRISPGEIVLKTPDGETTVPCDRIIARLGAMAPRRFVESCGIKFTSDEPSALPELSERYESSVPGLYVVGALAGYPLIKLAMNQGYEVVETISGNEISPADEPLLEEIFAALHCRGGNEVLKEILVLLQI